MFSPNHLINQNLCFYIANFHYARVFSPAIQVIRLSIRKRLKAYSGLVWFFFDIQMTLAIWNYSRIYLFRKNESLVVGVGTFDVVSASTCSRNFNCNFSRHFFVNVSIYLVLFYSTFSYSHDSNLLSASFSSRYDLNNSCQINIAGKTNIFCEIDRTNPKPQQIKGNERAAFSMAFLCSHCKTGLMPQGARLPRLYQAAVRALSLFFVNHLCPCSIPRYGKSVLKSPGARPPRRFQAARGNELLQTVKSGVLVFNFKAKLLHFIVQTRYSITRLNQKINIDNG